MKLNGRNEKENGRRDWAGVGREVGKDDNFVEMGRCMGRQRERGRVGVKQREGRRKGGNWKKKEGRMDGWMDGSMDRQMDGPME